MLKAVIDTNILINGSVDDNNYGNRIVDAVIGGKVAAYANRATLRENQLLTSLKVEDEDYRRKLQLFFGKVHRVADLKESVNVVADPEDNKLVSSAVAAGAGFLVSADHHLLQLEEFQGVKIVDPLGFWTVFEESSGLAWKNWLTDFIRP